MFAVCILVLSLFSVITKGHNISSKYLSTDRSKYFHSIHEFEEATKYLLSVPSEDQCSKIPGLPFIVIVVKSAVSNIERRNIIRDKWGSQAHSLDIPVVFIIGKSIEVENDAPRENNIAQEQAEHKDIIIGDFAETYYNLTLKTLSAMSWAHKYCRGVKWFFFANDDVILNPSALFKKFSETAQDVNSFHCFLHTENRYVNRDTTGPYGRWAIPVEVIPQDKYPVYCGGHAYILPGKDK